MGKLVKLDDDGNPIIESVVDVVTIKVDGQDVEVPQSAAQILEKAEHDLKSRNERALREGRENLSALLAEDTNWYANHPAELWSNYQPKVNGGKGFTGDPAMLIEKPAPTKESEIKTSKTDDSEVKSLREELRRAQEQITVIQTDLGKTGENKVIETRTTLAARYPNADIDSVNDGLRVFFTNNQRHPSAVEIEDIMKKRHDFVSTKIAAATKVHESTVVLPPVGGGTPPSISKTKTPRINEIDAWVDLAKADHVSPG